MNNTQRTAYILQIHKNPEQVNMFIEQLISEGSADVFVHIDKRNYENMYPKMIKSPYVKVIEQSIICEWGDISQVTTTILLLREVLRTKINYDFVCFRSGQDLLVKDGFKEFLMDNKNNIFLSLKEVSRKNRGLIEIKWPKITRRRYPATHPFRICRRFLQTLYRKGINILPNKNYWPKEFTFFRGSQWFTIPHEVAIYIIDFLDQNEWYYTFFKDALIPDEWFFTTLIMNSHFKKNVVNNNLLFLIMGDGFDGNSPRYLKIEDIDLINESGQFFARKFDYNIDNSVIEYYANTVRFIQSKILSS
ncbi:beta-1,6-N-acetylglucosaminyltransferase [Neobacillus drentensis]|uniref:beta-1,6-N-acetylglucosaminyltransferase n=1 Tax=Neobacillus drentensis TaxID=220684 RepID=UPI002FFE3788